MVRVPFREMPRPRGRDTRKHRAAARPAQAVPDGTRAGRAAFYDGGIHHGRFTRSPYAAGAPPAARLGRMLNGEEPPASAPEFEAHVRSILELIGENPEREGLLRTPQRVAASLS